MSKIKILFLITFLSTLLTSCQAIGDIFSAGVWVGIVIVVIVIIILFVVFGRKK